MKTVLHHFAYDLSKPIDKELYSSMVARIEANSDGRGRKMHSLSNKEFDHGRAGTSEEIEIEPEYIFDNQWNSTAGRVFDWYEEAIFFDGREQRSIKRGHWVEITAEMAKMRAETLRCGYCGKLYGPGRAALPSPVAGSAFCLDCLGSEYLKPTDFPLLRLLPVASPFPADREPLSEQELAELSRLYVAEQTVSTRSRAAQARQQQRAHIAKKYEKATAAAKTEFDGFTWLLDRGANLENVIYYGHTDTFSFGWRSPVSKLVGDELSAMLKDFPFKYEIKLS